MNSFASGNVNSMSHAEVLGTHIKPETQTSGFQEYPKMVGYEKPTEAELLLEKEKGIKPKPRPIIVKSQAEELGLQPKPSADAVEKEKEAATSGHHPAPFGE